MRSFPFVLSSSLALAIGASAAQAQVHQDWLNILDVAPTGFDFIETVETTPSGAVYAGGMTGLHDVLLEKLDSRGNRLWTRTFDLGGGIDFASELVVEPLTDAVYVLGRGDNPESRGLVLKYDAAGALLWTSVYAA